MATDKTWQVGSYHDEWAAIVHAPTRGVARMMGAWIDFDDFTDIRAVRLPSLDGKLITTETLVEAGFPETWEGEPIDPLGYIDFCYCDICKASKRHGKNNG